MSATVYRLFDRDGALLYVGMSASAFVRWSRHSRDKPWWTDVQRCEVEHLPDRAAAMVRELEVIHAERPRYNVVGNMPVEAWRSEPDEDIDGQLYGLAELAEASGVKPGTVSQWYRRGKLPKPAAVLAATPVWTGRSIERWIAEQRAASR